MEAVVEKFVKIFGYEDYVISSSGEIRRFPFLRDDVVATNKAANGGLKVTLGDLGYYSTRMLNRLVAENFLDDYDDQLEVVFIDGDKTNCRVDNLKMGTMRRRGRRRD
jgi:hypothetical protein